MVLVLLSALVERIVSPVCGISFYRTYFDALIFFSKYLFLVCAIHFPAVKLWSILPNIFQYYQPKYHLKRNICPKFRTQIIDFLEKGETITKSFSFRKKLCHVLRLLIHVDHTHIITIMYLPFYN